MLSFCFRRRIISARERISSETLDDEQVLEINAIRLPFVSVGPEASLQRPLTPEAQKQRTGQLEDLFKILLKIDEKGYLSIVRSIHLYQHALLNYRYDVGLAYTLLVASVETIAQAFIGKETVGTDFTKVGNSEEWRKLFKNIGLNESQQGKIENQLIKNEMFLSLRFRRFIEDYLPNSFWTSPDSRAWEEQRDIESQVSQVETSKDIPKDHPRIARHKEGLDWLRKGHESLFTEKDLDGLIEATKGKSE